MMQLTASQKEPVTKMTETENLDILMEECAELIQAFLYWLSIYCSFSLFYPFFYKKTGAQVNSNPWKIQMDF